MNVSNKSVGVFPQLKGVLLFMVAAVLLVNVTPVLEAAPDSKAGVNSGQTKKILDPFKLVSASVVSTSRASGPKTPRSDIPDGAIDNQKGPSENANDVARIVVPTRARSRSPYKPGW
ncbi:MAG: hypothetical protein J7L69_01715 [Desulfobulbaceae bacterium]|nr:hypothetical protein [Desulfobulbaceae bacterium]